MHPVAFNSNKAHTHMVSQCLRRVGKMDTNTFPSHTYLFVINCVEYKVLTPLSFENLRIQEACSFAMLAIVFWFTLCYILQQALINFVHHLKCQ
jgi:hypothetical protein